MKQRMKRFSIFSKERLHEMTDKRYTNYYTEFHGMRLFPGLWVGFFKTGLTKEYLEKKKEHGKIVEQAFRKAGLVKQN